MLISKFNYWKKDEIPCYKLEIREINKALLTCINGYMAPEYAMQGFFLVKSDVFSFGVLVLETIRGRKNNGFYVSEHDETLLLHVSNPYGLINKL